MKERGRELEARPREGGEVDEPDHRAQEEVEGAVSLLMERLSEPPRLLIVTGSGLGGLADMLDGGVEIPFETLPGYPSTGVVGHTGSYLAGRMEGEPILIQRGRYHLYEGYSREGVTMPIRVAARLGVQRILLTNAAGGIRADLLPGRIVLLHTCLDFQKNPPLPPAVFTLDSAMRASAKKAAEELSILLPEGCYAGVLGPSFETPAEIQMLSAFGGDVVGMSTVAEVAAAIELNLSVLGLSLVTNRAAGTGGGKLDHEEVLRVGAAASTELMRLIRGIVGRLPPLDLRRSE